MLPRAQEEQSCSREHAERFPGAQEDRFCSREVAERLPRAQDGLFGSRELATHLCLSVLGFGFRSGGGWVG